VRAEPDRADNKAGNYSHGCRRIALIGVSGLAGRHGFRRYDQGKMEAWELAFSPALNARMRAKVKSWFYS
jgi:hypothetical protein